MDIYKYCPKCKQNRSLADFTRCKGRADGLASWCKFCHRKQTRGTAREARKNFILELGGKCEKCGFDDLRALQIDHINGDGYSDPYREMSTSAKFYQFVRENRDRFQLLCANCNTIKRIENAENGVNYGRPNIYPIMRPDEYTLPPGRGGKWAQAWHDSLTDEERESWKISCGRRNVNG